MKSIFKKPITLILSIILVSSLTTPTIATTPSSDYALNWAKETIQSAITSGIAHGYPDGSFKPNNEITRAEFFELTNNVFSFTREVDITYPDVAPNAWYAPVISKAEAAGYIVGYPDGTVKPEGKITRQEVAVIINSLKSLNTVSETVTFNDALSIADWSFQAVKVVAGAKIMIGYPDGSFKPEAQITRAEALVSITRAFSLQTMYIAVYYLKNSANEMYLVREMHKLEKNAGVAQAALNELISGTPLTEGAQRVLPADTKILGITIENGLATIDFSKEVLSANVGSSGEALGIASIVNTLTEFPTIQQVQFFVEGSAENGMDWWGHVGLYEQPFQRNLSMVYEPAIWVTSPVAGQTITSSVKIQGNARVFEAMVSYRLKDADGNILVQGSTMATAGAPEHGTFEVELKFIPLTAGNGQLEVFEESMKDGSDLNVVVIPVNW